MDPTTCPAQGTRVQAGDYIGEYQTPNHNDNGSATGPHLHYERRDANGNSIDPGDAQPIPNGRVTTGFGVNDAAHPLRTHPRGHRGIDVVNP